MKPEEALLKTKIALMERTDLVFFSTLLLNLVISFNDYIPTARTNGVVIELNTEFFLGLTKDERMFLLVHEAMHVAYMHCIRGATKDHNKFNQAADYVINLELVNRGLKMPSSGLIDKKYSGMSTEEVYELLPDNLPKPEIDDIEINTDIDGDTQQMVEGLLVKAYTQAKMSNSGIGDIPGELEIFINKLLTPKLPWYTILNKYINKIVKDDYSFRKPNRRYLPDYYLPSLYSENVEDITVAIDISGSVSDSEFTQFITEVTHIVKRIKPKTTTLILFEQGIKSINKISDIKDLAKIRFIGRGGTDIKEVVTHLNKTKPVISLIFTDGDFYVPKKDIKSPVIWLIHNNPKWKIHYGKTIHYKV